MDGWLGMDGWGSLGGGVAVGGALEVVEHAGGADPLGQLAAEEAR